MLYRHSTSKNDSSKEEGTHERENDDELHSVYGVIRTIMLDIWFEWWSLKLLAM